MIPASLLAELGLSTEALAAIDAPGPLTDCVYYWLRDGLIKIGHTRCLGKRLTALAPGALLAIEPGGYSIEQGRHNQFADYHEPEGPGTEWFRPGPLLIWHIEAMSSLYPVNLLDELPQMRVPRKQLTGSPVSTYEASAAERLATWIQLLPQIAAEAAQT